MQSEIILYFRFKYQLQFVCLTFGASVSTAAAVGSNPHG